MNLQLDRATAGMLATLLVLVVMHLAARAGHVLPGRAGQAIATMANRDVNKEGREALTAGYYEGLINEGSRLGGMNALVAGSRKFTTDDPRQPDRRRIDEFRYYELIPNSDVPDYLDTRVRYRLKTNSGGQSDKEYSVAKPEGSRRLALFGDSITRGQGAPYQENYEALLETALTDERTRGGLGPLEIINFAVGSYSLMQMMDTAITRAASYSPDVYVVALTDRCVYRAWGHHLAILMQAGIDLKYDHLRSVVRDAGVTGREPQGVFDAKMARYRIPTIRWSLQMIRDHARSQGAEMLVLLIPTADDPALLAEEFLGVKEVLDELDVAYLDVVDTFAGMRDRSPIRVAEHDRHPNREGHQLLFEALARELRQSPHALRVVHGTGSPQPRPGPPGRTNMR